MLNTVLILPGLPWLTNACILGDIFECVPHSHHLPVAIRWTPGASFRYKWPLKETSGSRHGEGWRTGRAVMRGGLPVVPPPYGLRMLILIYGMADSTQKLELFNYSLLLLKSDIIPASWLWLYMPQTNKVGLITITMHVSRFKLILFLHGSSLKHMW